MSPANASAFAAKAGTAGTSAKALVGRCQDSIDNPGSYSDRSANLDSDMLWSGVALACAFSYAATGSAAHLSRAIYYWRASLDDFRTLGDGSNCTAAASTYDWKNLWDGNLPRPPMFNSIAVDTGYPMRWYGPNLALVYDWLHDAPGVDASLLGQTRTCLTAWLDNYTLRGYNRAQPGSNYHAGFAVGKTLAAIAFGNEGTDGHLWTEVLHDLFEKQLVGSALSTAPSYGPLVGGDFDTWQYGPLSVAEYAVSARAMEEAGVAQPAMDAWVNGLALRHVYAQLPTPGREAVGNGDYENSEIYHPTSALQLDAVILGPSSDQAAGWAAGLKSAIGASAGSYFYNALAEIRSVVPQDYRTQSPAPPPWYVARGTGTMFARAGWDAAAYWGVLMSPTNHGEVDHVHWAAGNFVFSRGGDHLVVDPSNYGEPGTLETNAIAADTPKSVYPPSQTPWGLAYLPWARASAGNVFAARSDFAEAFRSNDGLSSNVPYARRDWTMLPEGEVVLVDRMHLADATKKMYLSIHTNTRPGGLALTGGAYLGSVGSSKVAIHPVYLSGGPTPTVAQPPVRNDYSRAGNANNARFAVDDYRVSVPGSWAVAVHVIDGLGAGEVPAQVGSLNDDNYDPAPKQNGSVIGAAVYRGSKQSFVVASSAVDGSVGATMTYRIPGGSASRHVVFDAPEDGSGGSVVSSSESSGSCLVTITAGAGFAGRPLMFSVAAAPQGCVVSEDTDVPPGDPPPGGGVTPPPGGGGASGQRRVSAGCSAAPGAPQPTVPFALALWLVARRKRRRPKEP
jgi:hypothetical protein